MGEDLLSTQHIQRRRLIKIHLMALLQHFRSHNSPSSKTLLGQLILASDGIVVDTAEGEDDGADYACAILSGGAVQEERSRLGRDMAEDLAVRALAVVEDVSVSHGKSLFRVSS